MPPLATPPRAPRPPLSALAPAPTAPPRVPSSPKQPESMVVEAAEAESIMTDAKAVQAALVVPAFNLEELMEPFAAEMFVLDAEAEETEPVTMADVAEADVAA